MLLLRNEDKHQNNPLASFATFLCNRAVEVEPEQFWMVEPKHEIWVPVHGDGLWGKRLIQIIQCFFLWFFGPNCSGAGAKSF